MIRSKSKPRSLLSTQTKSVRFGGTFQDTLQENIDGNSSNYDILLGQILDPKAKSSQIVGWFEESARIAYMLDKGQRKIVDALLKVRWMEREAEVTGSYQSFIVALVSANPVHLRSVLTTLTKCFIPPNTTTEKKFAMSMTASQVSEVVHSILQKILDLIPQATALLGKVFADGFPYAKRPVTTLQPYMENMLVVTSYQPNLRRRLLEIIVQNLVKLDVNAPRQDIEDAEAEEEDNSDDDEEDGQKMFQMDEDVPAAVESNEMKHATANALDILMEILFKYIHGICYREGELQLNETHQLYKMILPIFDEVVLPVHQICHVQFVIFYICSFKASFHVHFLQHLWSKLTNPSTTSVVRQSAVCYVSGFIARAKFIPVTTATTYIQTMSNWAHNYLKQSYDAHGASHYVCDVMKHGTFYSVCQSLFYVIVFRHKDILNMKTGYQFMQGLNLHRLIISQLNPLRVCLPGVVSLFSSLMRINQLVYCDTIIQRNNRQMLPVVGTTSSALSSKDPLDCFFPFDPYLLKRSASFVTPHYTVWEGRSPDPDDDNNENEDDQLDDLMDDTGLRVESMELFDKQIIPSPIGLSPGFADISPMLM